VSLFHAIPGIVSQQQSSGPPPAPTTLWSDDFNRSNGAFSDSDVTAAGGAWVISGNVLTNSTDYAQGTILVDGPTYDDNQFVEFTWDVADGYACWIFINATVPQALGSPVSVDSGYCMRFDTNSPGEFYRAGTFAQWMAIGTPAPGDTISLHRVDAGGGSAAIRCYVNGTLVDTYTDSSPLTGGYPGWGLVFRDSTQGMMTFDDASTGEAG
jgi:hypothetical protein